MYATALIAEDEPLLAANLQAELARLWPELRIVASVGDGASALQQGLTLQPDLLFLDIRMPGMSGLEAAQALAEDWPDSGRPLPLLVFVTAYDEYALHAFERAALDYVLKPVQPERLAKTCARLQAALQAREQREQPQTGELALTPMIDQLRALFGAAAPRAAGLPDASTQNGAAQATAPLRMIQASAGNTITMIPVGDVLYFEAADKYVRVMTAEREHLIRTSLRELLVQLDPQQFWQIHRGTVVRADVIASASRDESGKLTLSLRGHPAKLSVSRLYADQFKGM
ncbi:LytR/AlgR family response regulator transcription factor [Paraburkholderia phenazinium]|jgi:DNA-binding LytR/AlgR family response regulator|uniref:DNA-binding response regulator, LytR/AlgR family n=1 Tax=Paraburkholderia phenazinium TaxID=60549 RepID=A0A1G8AP78_9BURK|nr:LytTR family DNA-binding domain-containing protein [Paraburkholderia phenazinium]SDH22674.1 DNA-binding response regulator, LytR/AlgR family [Paraburkholderia phenazinium]